MTWTREQVDELFRRAAEVRAQAERTVQEMIESGHAPPQRGGESPRETLAKPPPRKANGHPTR